MGFVAVLCIVLGYSIAQAIQQNLRQTSQSSGRGEADNQKRKQAGNNFPY